MNRADLIALVLVRTPNGIGAYRVVPVPNDIEIDMKEGTYVRRSVGDEKPRKIATSNEVYPFGSETGLVCGVYDRTSDEHLSSMLNDAFNSYEWRNSPDE